MVKVAPLPSPRQLLFGLHVDAVTMREAVRRCEEAIQTRHPLTVGVLNAAKIVNLRRDSLLRESLLSCDMMLADGQSVVWASRILGRPLPERVAGIDLFEQLLDLADREHRSIYLLGARPDVLASLKRRITQKWLGLRIVGSHHGYFRDGDAPAIADRIAASGADMLFLGMASPKKEIFLGRFGAALGVPVLHGVGGSFDILAGLTRRAPLAWQKLGLEWAYRLLQEPRRLWRRYFVTNTSFIILTLRELLRPSPAFAARAEAHSGQFPTRELADQGPLSP